MGFQKLRTAIWLAFFLGALHLCGCGPEVQTRAATWPNGRRRATESFYMNSAGYRVMHGGSTYQDADGAVVAEGRWRHGKCWDGVCWVPAAGDAGSWGGLGRFERYKDGQFVESLPGRP